MARVSISSPRTIMPTSSGSYGRNTSRRNSLTTYNDSYTSTSYTNPHSTVRTGASRDSFNNAASRFETTSSQYGNSYVSSKPPAHRRITSPSTRASYLSKPAPRPLPAGPGPRDQNGTKMSVTEVRNTMRKTSRPNYSDSTTRTTPLKADHSYANSNGYSSHSSLDTDSGSKYSTYSSSTYQSPRLSRDKRTNSISDLSAGMDRVSISPSESFSRTSRKYSSTTDINGNVDQYTPRSEFQKSSPVRTHVTTTTLNSSSPIHQVNGTSPPLPDINDRPNSATSRSPSIDRLVRNNNTLNNNYNTSSPSSSSRQRSSSSPESGNRGLVGLRNLGNTCFMNCVIQCLSHTPALRKYFLKNDHLIELNTAVSVTKGAIAKSFGKLLAQMWSTNSTVSPSDFREKVTKFADRFSGYSQQDAHEFLVYLREGLNEDLNRNKAKKKRLIDCDDSVVSTPPERLAEVGWAQEMAFINSFFMDLFGGQLRSALTCTKCDYTSNTFDAIMDLQVPVKKKYSGSISLDDCFRLYMVEEVLDGDEKPRCARCKCRQRCTRRISIQRFPEILVIVLKRFSMDSYSKAKINTYIDYPLYDLDLTEYMSSSCSASSRERFVYDLYAVSCHSGTQYMGHYYAFAKTSGNSWHQFNDTRVSSAQSSDVVCPEGYILFYQRKSNH